METHIITDQIKTYISQGLSLPEAFLKTAEMQPGHGMLYINSTGREERLTYAEMLAQAEHVLGGLREAGLTRGHVLVLQLENELQFAVAFWAALLGGIKPVPLTVPANFHHQNPGLQKLLAVCRTLERFSLVCGDDLAASYAASLKRGGISPQVLCYDALQTAMPADAWTPGRPDDTAFLMYSSGSTGQAKGVRLSHRNLLHNIAQIADRSGLHDSDCSVTWLPYTHDMGLILFHLAHCLTGIPQIKTTSLGFMRDPLETLRLIDRHRATLTGQPNFAFEHMLRHIDHDQAAGLDLSCLRLIYNGAEPISAGLCREFIQRFAAAGLPASAISPGYGIAEACVCATQHPRGSRLDREICPVLTVNRNALVEQGVAEPAGDGEDNPIEIVNLGPPMNGMDIRVTDDHGTLLPERHVGALQIHGPNVTAGYHGAPDAPQVLPGGWLDSGDLGFIHRGNVFITGRKKDVIFINGQNFYAHDLEGFISRETGLESTRVAVCGYRSPDRRKERVAVFVRARPDEQTLHQLNRIKAQIATAFGFEVHQFVPVRALPRTSSGKLRRYALTARLERGEFDHQAAGVASRMAALRTVITPGTRLEHDLLAVCAASCDTPPEQISVHWTFADLAGDSLKLVGLLQALTGATAHPDCTRIRLGDLHIHNTVNRLARALEDGLMADNTILSLEPVPGHQHPLSRQQQDIWVLQQLEENSAAYHEAYCCELRQPLDVDQFRNALQEVTACHSSLRTRFVPAEKGFPEQIIDARPELDFTYLDLMAPPGEQGETSLETCVRALAEQPFDISRKPSCRFALIRTDHSCYTFFICAHHLVIDGWGFRQLFQTLQQAYEGSGSPRPEKWRPVDYYKWVAAKRNTPEYREATQYWKELITPWPPRPGLGTTGEPPNTAAVAVCRVGHETAGHLDTVARSWGVTPFQLALSGYLLTLARVFEIPDIAVGITVAGRSEPEAFQIVGYLANTVAVRVDIRQWRTTRDLALEVRRQVETALRFQDFPLSEFTGGNTRSGHAQPLYTTAFSLLESPLNAEGPLEFQAARRLRCGTKLDLLLNIETEGDEWVCYWEYDAGRLNADDISSWHQILLACWNCFDENGDVLINHIRLGHDAAPAHIKGLADTKPSRPRLPLVTDYFEARAGEHPEKTAVTYGGIELSYGELQTQMNALAVVLRDAGVCPETRVMVLLPKGCGLAVATLAVIKAGGAYVPCDTDYPRERIVAIAAKAKPKALITLSECLEGIDLAGLSVQTLVCLDTGPCNGNLPPDCRIIDAAPAVSENRTPPIDSLATAEDPVYVHFTSGTTGEPKGIVNSHRSVCHLIDWYETQGIYQEGDHIAQMVSYAFEAFAGELFPALAVGATLHIMPSLKTIAPVDVLAILARKEISVTTLSPSYALQLFRPGQDTVGLTALHTLMFGGEALLPAHVKTFRTALAPTTRLINAYGPTEATVHTTCYPVPESSDQVCIGKPLPGKKVIVADPCGMLCEPGEPGEIMIGGEGLALGYLDDETLTRRAFVQYEAVTDKVERFYRTGDTGVFDCHGLLHYKGRMDHQVKINGQRIEPEEVEKALSGHPGVYEAAVITESFRAGQIRLVGCYCANDDIPPTGLSRFLQQCLPSYMVPSRFVRVKEMPKSANSKVDRKALAGLLATQPPGANAEKEKTAQPGTGKIHAVVAEAWKKILGIPSVRNDTHFFTAGGDSILALELVSTLTRKGYRLSPKEVFAHPTLGEQLALLDPSPRPETEPETEPKAEPADQKVHGPEGPSHKFSPTNTIRQHTLDTPYMVGPVHCYTMEVDGRIVLFDTGPPTEGAKQYLRENIDLERLDYIFITHCHIDHCGLAPWLADHTRAKVYLPARDGSTVLSGDEKLQNMYGLFKLLGFDESYLEKLHDFVHNGNVFPPYPKKFNLVEEGIPPHLGIDFLSCPGHSQSDLVYFTENWAVTGDILLEGGNQSPLLSVDPETAERFNNYRAYCDSLKKYAALRHKTICPGHGVKVDSIDHCILFDIRKTLNRVVNLNRISDRKHVAGIIEQRFGRPLEEPLHAYLVASEVMFMLDFLAEPEYLKASLETIGLFDAVAQAYERAVSGQSVPPDLIKTMDRPVRKEGE